MASKLALTIGMVVLFGLTVMVLLRLMPGPHRPTDYLVIGTLATFICLLVAFLAWTVMGGRGRDAFFKRRVPKP